MSSRTILFLVFLFAFFFHCRSFSPCWPLAFLIFSPLLWNLMFFFQRNLPPLFLITLPSSFSVIHVSEDIKNNVENTLLCCYFFLCKSLGGPGISRQKNLELLFFFPYLLIELFCIGIPVVRTDRRTYGHVTIKIFRMHRPLAHLP